MLVESGDHSGAAGPILRWAGSKKTVLHKLEALLPDEYDRYMELFAGSACLFFRAKPPKAIISDNNKELIGFYSSFTESPHEIYEAFIKLPRNAETFYKIRKEILNEKNRIQKGAYFLYLNRNCFNGIYRTNAKGEFNVPFSSNRIANYPDKEEFLASAQKFSAAEIFCGDFNAICRKNLRSNDFVYLDPPYYVPNVRVFREYSDKHFSENDFGRLDRLVKFIDRRGAKFMLSYPDCSLARTLGANWVVSRIHVTRIIGGRDTARKGKYELVIRNYQ